VLNGSRQRVLHVEHKCWGHEMKIQIRARDVKVTKALRAHVELRLGFALSRFGEQIGRVTVHFSNSEEHHSSPEKRCRIVVDLQRSVKVQETDADVFAAVTRAADRVARSVAHAIEQEHQRAENVAPPSVRGNLRRRHLARSGAAKHPVPHPPRKLLNARTEAPGPAGASETMRSASSRAKSSKAESSIKVSTERGSSRKKT